MPCPIGCAVRCDASDMLCWFNGRSDVHFLLDREQQKRRTRVDAMLREEGRPDLADDLAANLRDVDSGVSGARNVWHSISSAQRHALQYAANAAGGQIERVGKEYLDRLWTLPDRRIHAPTIRALCLHELMAWDGGLPDPEAAVVVTERGRFVLKHGPMENVG